MRLVRPNTFIERYFDPSEKIDERAVRRWVEKGVIAGKIINTGQRAQVFVDADAWENSTGNLLADKILQQLGRVGN